MVVLEAFQSLSIAILVSYLSFTNSLASYIQDLLPIEQEEERSPISSQEPSDELLSISKLFATSKGIAGILRENQVFQDALTGTEESAALIASSGTVTEDMVLSSLVNIFCEYRTEEYTRTITGTGFFVNEKGVILTNAHVAQFLLLEGADTSVKDAECSIRSGDPATPRYHAELLFISPTWILNNAALITDESPRGTGEYDYALLYVSESTDDTPLPSSYPALPFNTDFIPVSFTGSTVLSAGYPAEKLIREGSRAELVPKIAETTVDELYTFGSNYADIFSLSTSQVGEQGSSGGPVVDPESGALGLIVTKGNIAEDGANSLRALTLSYINRTILAETGYSLARNSSGDLPYRSAVFKKAMVPFLTQLLSFELER